MAGSLTHPAISRPPVGERVADRLLGIKAASILTALTLLANLTFAPTVGAEPVMPPGKPAGKAATSAPSKASQSAADPFAERRIVINIPSRTLWLYQGNAIIRYFPVGVGRPGFMTPVGKYSIISKVIDPGWENPYLPSGKVRLAPGEDNPLGTRWMGFYQKAGGEYGMHGTDNPTSVGRFSSHGCVRMKVRDAETLFDMVEMGTPVEVVYEPVLIRKQGNLIRVSVYADRFHRGMPTLAQLKNKILKQYPTAQLDLDQLKAALAQPTEHPTSVGAIPEEDILQVQVAEPPTAQATMDVNKTLDSQATETQTPAFNPPDSAQGGTTFDSVIYPFGLK